MRWVLFAALMSSPLMAEDQLLSGIVRGKITEPVAVGQGGTFLLTEEGGRSLRCAYDVRTWFESQRVRVSLDAFTPAQSAPTRLSQCDRAPHAPR